MSMRVEKVDVPQPNPPAVYNILGLTASQAADLRMVLGNIAGSSRLREETTSVIYDQLCNAGAGYPDDVYISALMRVLPS